MDSPISLLSSELIALIVDHLLDDCAVSNADPRACGPEDDTIFASHRIIRCIAQVSTFWRLISLGNPLWWSNISIVHPWSLEEVKLRLERAQKVPLDLRIFGHVGYTTRNRKLAPFRGKDIPYYVPPLPPMLATYTELFEIILPVLERCRVMHIRGVFADENRVLPFDILQRMVEAPMPMLEQVTWEGELNRFKDDLARLDYNAFFRHAPNLNQLRLVGIDITRFHIPTSDSFPSSSLTTLHLSRGCSSTIQISLSLLKTMFVAYPLLSTLAIYDDILNTDNIRSPIPMCTAPTLKSLYMLGNMLSVSQLLLFLHAPQMTELVITPTVHTDLEELVKDDHSTNSTTTADATDLPQITCRTDRFPKLTSLTLAPAFPQDIIHTLIYASECFPLIERLIMVLPPTGYLDNFLDSFTPAMLARHGAHKATFPHLRDLALHLDLNLVSPSTVPSLSSGTDPNNQKQPSQYDRVSRWTKVIREIHHIRNKQLGLPLDNILIDEGSYNSFHSLARLGMSDPTDGRLGGDSNSDSEASGSPFGNIPPVKIGNLWEGQRRKMLFTQVKDLFLGSVSEGF